MSIAFLFLLAYSQNGSELNVPKIDTSKNQMQLLLLKDKAREEFKNMKEKKQQLDSTNPALLHILID
jgi:hypothetical protein